MKTRLKHYQGTLNQTDRQMDSHNMFLDRKVQNHKMLILPKLIYKFKVTEIRISTVFSETRQPNYKVIMERNQNSTEPFEKVTRSENYPNQTFKYITNNTTKIKSLALACE